MNKMCVSDYRTEEEPYGNQPLYILDKPMLNEGGNIIVYPFGFEPTFHRYRMDTIEKLKTGCRIFVGAMADIFGEWVPDEWLQEVFAVCERSPQHNYLFLTKNPDRYVSLLLEERLPERKNMWYGVTVTNKSQARTAEATMQDMSDTAHAFLSIEPLLEDISEEIAETIANFTDWIIIGAETGLSSSKVVPETEWISRIVNLADECKVPVFMKDSLEGIVGSDNMRREYPSGLLRKELSEKKKEKLCDMCCICGKFMRKSEMVSLYAKAAGMGMPKVYAWMCDKDFKDYCKKLRVQNPTENGGADEDGK